MTRRIAILALFAIFETGGWAQSSENAAGILQQVSASYGAAATFYLEATETTRTRAGDLDRVRARRLVTAQDAAHHWRVEIEDSVLHLISVFDGRLTTTYQPVSGQYLEEEGVPTDSASTAVANLLHYFTARYSALQEQLQEARLLREETCELGGRNVPCLVIEAAYAAPPGTAIATVRRTFWIDPKESRVLREESAAQMAAAGRERTVLEQTISFRSAVLGDAPSSELFAFSPPPGSRKVASFENEPARELVGGPAPAFALTSLDGTSYDLESLRGKIVLLNFWATWCVPCRLEMPLLEELHRSAADKGLVILGINDEAPETARRFLEEQGYTFPTLSDAGNRVARAYAVELIPTTVGIDRNGNVAFRHAGPQGKEEIVQSLTGAGLPPGK